MIIKKIDTFVQQHNLIFTQPTVILGLSGGPDSVFLFHYLLRLHEKKELRFIAAHLDHEWRKASSQDTTFCRQLAEQHNIPFISQRASELDINFKKRGSLEDLGRRMRRFFLESVAKQYNATAIALAHHYDDQQETFFIRMIRGTTVSGLSCIKPKSDMYIRPLLHTKKEDIISYLDAYKIADMQFCMHQDIISYLDAYKIAYLQDPTNNSDTILRNRIRKTLIPAIKSVDNRFENNFQQLIDDCNQTEHYLTQETKKLFHQLATTDQTGTVQINKAEFLALDPFIQRRIIIIWLYKEKVVFTLTKTFIDEIIRFIHNTQSKQHAVSNTWSIVKQKNLMYIDRIYSHSS